MKAIEFPEVNYRIGENQHEYETLPVHKALDVESDGFFNQVTMCFELDDEERKHVAETGQIWHTVLIERGTPFNPIRLSSLKPEMK